MWIRLCLAFALTLVMGCGLANETCEDVACDAATQFCMVNGSDTMAPNSAECLPLPEPCLQDRSCACLEQQAELTCFVANRCEDGGELVETLCPQG